MTYLIGISGHKRAGKGETGLLLSDHFNNPAMFGFADKLKIAAARALGFDRPEAELIALMDSFKETAKFDIHYHEPEDIASGASDGRLHEVSGREYLQFFGTEAGRNTFADNFWVDLVLPPLTHGGVLGYAENDGVIITDVRFPNEAQRIRDLHGVIIDVRRPGFDGDGHASEQGLPPELIDYIIENDEGLDKLADAVDVIADEIFA